MCTKPCTRHLKELVIVPTLYSTESDGGGEQVNIHKAFELS